MEERLDVRACVLAVVVGAISGGLAAAFRLALRAAEQQHVRVAAVVGGGSTAATIAVVVAAAIVAGIAGWLTFRFAPETSGSGIPEVESRLADGRAMRGGRVVPVKFTGGMLSLAAGLSLGREGPTVQMSAAIADGLARAAGCDAAAVRALVAAGAGAGLAAAFDAPLAGAIFVFEELRQRASARTVTVALLATLVANVVLLLTLGDTPAFHLADPPPLPASLLPLSAVVGVFGALVGVVFDRGLLRALGAVDRMPAPRWLLTGAAGVLAGLMTIGFVAAVGDGEAVAQAVLRGDPSTVAAPWLAALLIGKLALTVTSYASGAPGGIFAPLLVMGAAAGALVAHAAAGVVDTALVPALAMAGMTAVFTAVVRAPITGIVLIEEMTSGQDPLLSLTVAAAAAFVVATALREPPLYESLRLRRPA